ncbi:MAG TPA: serine/threonine-protein kinase [Kofleriaceae bacterium]|nr:serine/threonine-protein kinase [Kofleriaceae bacterium]
MAAEGPGTRTTVVGGIPMPDTTQVAPPASAGAADDAEDHANDDPADGADAGEAAHASGAHATRADSPRPDPPRFHVGDEVARGGMGRVVAARDERLGRAVAIKEALDADAATLRRFEREVQITARLQHPAIVPLYDAGRWPSGLPYYVMRLVSGRPLLEHIDRARSLGERLALVPSFLAAADAVGFAHREGIIHRDLKPSNVLLGEHGETLVIDWGLAKVVGEPGDPHARGDAGQVRGPGTDGGPAQTRAGSVLGTPGYMAPEQAAGDPADARSDVYSLGATLYHLLAGAPPHGDSGPTAAMVEVLAGAPPTALSRRAPGVPPDLLAIVDKAMAPDPAQRYRDASALAADTRRFLTGQLVAAHRYSARDRLRRLARRHRAALVVAGLAAAVLVVTVAVGLTRIVAARQRAESARADAEAGRRSAEQARGRAQERADDLLLARAQALLDSDPTAAAALAGRLPPGSDAWPRARAVLTAARSRGIARALPGPREMIAVLAPDPGGRRLLSLDRTGQLEIHDLRRWTSRVLVRPQRGEAPPADAVWADGGRSIAIARGADVVLIDVESGRERVIGTGTGSGTGSGPGSGPRAPIVQLQAPVDASFVAWTDKRGRSATAAAPAWTAAPLHGGRPATWLEVSPDGRWLATSAHRQPLQLWQRGRRAPILTAGAGCQAAFHRRAARVAVSCGRDVVEWDLAAAPPRVRHRWRAAAPLVLVAYGGDTPYLLSPRGEVTALYPGGASETLSTSSRAFLPTQLPDGLVLSTGVGTVLVLEGAPSLTLRVPGASVVRLAVAGGGRQVVAGSVTGQILVFDLDSVRPRRVRVPIGTSRILSLSGEGAVTVRSSGEIDRIDAASGAIRTLGRAGGLGDRSRVSPDGSAVVMVTMEGEVVAVRPGDGAFEVLEQGGGSLVAFSGPDRAVWERGQALWEKQLFAGQSARRIAAWRARPIGVASSGGWLAGALDDGTLWRRAPGASAIEEIRSGRVVAPVVAVAPDGAVYASVEREILRWGRGGGAAVPFAALSDEIMLLELDPALGLSAVTTDGAVHLVPLAGGAIRSTPLAAPVLPVDLSPLGATAVGRDTASQPLAIDVAGGLGYVLAPVWALHVAQSIDGRVTGVLTGAGGLLLYTHDLPRDPRALRAWLAGATNAAADDRGSVTWPAAPLPP